jgi:glycosyltransferase involved in cell wall biosynthesis
MLNIWLIQTGEPLPLQPEVRKMRTAILAEKLVLKGHKVWWWTSAFDHFSKKWIMDHDAELELSNNFRIKCLKGIGYKKNFSVMRFIDHRIVAKKFKKLACQMRAPDVIIASMPPHDLAYEAATFCQIHDIPVLVDIRDPWPNIFLDQVPQSLKKIAKILLTNDFKMTGKTMESATGLIAASNPFLTWGLTYARREKTWRDRVFYLGYQKPTAQLTNPSQRFLKVIEELRNKFVVFFVGTISNSYHNPFLLVEAAKRLSQSKNIHFVLAGDGELFDKLNTMAMNCENITVTGWLTQQEIEHFLEISNIGVCPATKKVDLPTNKAFSYLSAGLPVISAFHGEMKDIIEKYNIGCYYPPNDVDKFINCLNKLYKDKTLYVKLSNNAYNIYKEKFNAEKIYDRYARHIERIVHEFRKTRSHAEGWPRTLRTLTLTKLSFWAKRRFSYF